MKITPTEVDAILTLMQKAHEDKHNATIQKFKREKKIDQRAKAVHASISKIPPAVIDLMTGGRYNCQPTLAKITDTLLYEDFPAAPKMDRDVVKAEIQILASEVETMQQLRARLGITIAGK